MKPLFCLRDEVVQWIKIPSRNPSPRQALNRSVQKWKFIVEQLEQGKRVLDDGEATTCSLCRLYIDEGAHGCKGCPVAAVTGKTHCDGTPFDIWVDTTGTNSTLRLRAAHAELNFLKALRRST